MSRSVKFYYGLSGTFKETTIKNNLKLGDDVLWSGIKRWKGWESMLGDRIPKSDLNLALLHLSRLADKEYNLTMDEKTLYVERGVTDMLYYWLQSHPTGNQETMIKSLVEEELRVSRIVGGGIQEPEKILLVQKDYEFVEKVVFNEPTRAACFPGGIRDYISSQDRYVDFTKKNNKISEIIYINDAREYLESIGVAWKLDDNDEINEQFKS